MADYIFSKHALEQMTLRGLTTEMVETILLNPDAILEEENGQQIYQAIFCRNGRDYLLRAFVNNNKVPSLVKTVYLTSKVNKYQ